MRVLLFTAMLLLAGCTEPTDLEAKTVGHPLQGQPAPDYAAVDLNGTEVSLADHLGRPVLFHIWASWCTVCELEEPALERLHAEFGDRVDFVTVSIDSPRYEDAMRAEAAEWPYENWWDPDDEVRPLFQVSYQPVTIFIDADGIVDSVWQGQRADQTTLRSAEEAARETLGRLV